VADDRREHGYWLDPGIDEIFSVPWLGYGIKRYFYHVFVIVFRFVFPAFLPCSPNKVYVTAVMGNSAHSSVWIQSPYEQVVRVDGIARVPGADLDLLHLSGPASTSRGVTPLGILPFQPSPGANHTCYAVGYSGGRNNETEAVLLRPDAKRCAGDSICLTVARKPHSCSVRNFIARRSSKFKNESQQFREKKPRNVIRRIAYAVSRKTCFKIRVIDNY